MDNLKMLRENKNLSQGECAEALGIPKTTYWSYETGRTQPSFNQLKKIAELFGCSIDFLLDHQTTDTLYLSGFSDTQKKIIELVKRLDNDQAVFTLGYLADMLKIPYSQVRPVRPV